MRLAVDPGRLIMGTFARNRASFLRLSYVLDAPPQNHAIAPRVRSETESGDRRDFSIFREEPMRLAVAPVRLILGPFAPLAPRARIGHVRK